MMGPRQVAEGSLFYEFSIEGHVPSDHLLREWKVKFGGQDVSDARKLNALEDENATLKRLLAEQMLDSEPMSRQRSERRWRTPSCAKP